MSVLCLVLGVILSAAVVTSKQVRSFGAPNRIGFDYNAGSLPDKEKTHLLVLGEEIKKLRQDKTDLEKAVSHNDSTSNALYKELEEAKIIAGLTPVVGSGVLVTLLDSKKQPMLGQDPQANLIHDSDINTVVNELRSAGAEAITVNGQRVVGSTSIRCAGAIVIINDAKYASPFLIQAIGNPDTLMNALNIPNGVLDGIRRYEVNMVRIEKQSAIHMPAYTGSTQFNFVHTEKAPIRGAQKAHN